MKKEEMQITVELPEFRTGSVQKNCEEKEWFPNGIIDAIYLDEEATSVRITYNTDEGATRQEVCTVDPTIPMFQDLMKHITLEEIDDATIKFNREMMNEQKAFEAFKRQAGGVYEETTPVKVIVPDDPIWNLDNLLNTITTGFTKEDLFALKLKVFETEIVQKNKNRELRSLIRKAVTPLEVLVHYDAMLKEFELEGSV